MILVAFVLTLSVCLSQGAGVCIQINIINHCDPKTYCVSCGKGLRIV